MHILICLLLSSSLNLSFGEKYIASCVSDIAKKYFDKEQRLVLSFTGKANDRKNTNNASCDDADKHKKESLLINRKAFEDVDEEGSSSQHLLRHLNSLARWSIIISKTDKGRRMAVQLKGDTKGDSYYVIWMDRGPACKNDPILDLAEQLNRLRKGTSWNVSARIVVALITEEGEKKLTEIIHHTLASLLRCKVENVIIVTRYLDPNRYQALLDIYTWSSNRGGGNCRNDKYDLLLLEQWRTEGSKGQFVNNKNLFPSRVPNNLYGCPITFSTFPIKPYIISPYHGVDSENKTFLDYEEGLDIRMIQTLAQKRNFSVVFLPPPAENANWGIKLTNGTWTGVVGEVLQGRSDFGLCGLMAKAVRFDILSASYAYMIDQIVWVVPRARPVPHWKSLFIIFPWNIWLLIAGAVVLATFFLNWLGCRERTEWKNYRSIAECLTQVWGAVLETPAAIMPRTNSMRAFFIFWVLFCMQISIAYQTFLVSFLSNPGFEHQITTVEELMNSGMEFGFHSNFNFLFDDSSSYSRMIMSKRVLTQDIDLSLERIARRGDFAGVIPKLYAKYSIAENYLDSKDDPLIKVLDSAITTYGVVMYTQKNNSLLELMDAMLSRMVESGFMLKWHRDVEAASIRGSSGSRDKGDDGVVVLTMAHLQGAFSLLGVGLSLSSLVFLWELHHDYITTTKKKSSKIQ